MRSIARNMLWVLLAALCITTLRVAVRAQGQASALQVGKTSIGGTVLNNSGKPEAGVWVIAETKLPVPYRKIVVTDDQGRFLVPDLPKGQYALWVRGYGLKDSDKVPAAVGKTVKLQVADEISKREAAKIYPAAYWVSMISAPAMADLPKEYKSQEQWLAAFRGACDQCHQLGMVQTRRRTTPDEWEEVLRRNDGMSGAADRLGRDLIKKVLANWATRIAAGEVPMAPPRPVGIERNFVVSQWDWGAPDSFVHDVTSTDKRNPTLYPYGKVYGADRTGGGRLWVLDPAKNTVNMLQVQPRIRTGYSTEVDYYHDRESPDAWMASPHNPMLDEQGRVWLTQPIRPNKIDYYPKWAQDVIATEKQDPAEIDLGYKLLLSRGHGMQLGFYDTKSAKFVGVDTVYNTHHLQFDKDGKLWSNAPGDVVALGMVDTKKIDPNNPVGTEAAAEKAWMRIDMKTQKTVPGQGYGVAVSPVDGTVWQTSPTVNGPENKLYKFDPKTRKFTDYPLPPPGRLSHGVDFSTDGNLWFSAGSGHLGRFDTKTEKFTYWDLPGPKYAGSGKETGSTEYPYYLWVDQFDTLGMGKDTVIVTGTTSDGMLIFNPKKETFQVFRMAYPMPFYTRGLDGRIDDAAAGWKGRGLWATYSSYLPKFSETRSGSVNHIQLRPNPLAN